MALRSIDFRFLVFKKAGTIAVSGVLMLLAFVFMVLCFSQLSASPPLMGGAQAAFAIASILQVILVALASTIIFACWKESGRLIRLSAYTTVAHLAVNVVVLASLLAVVTSVKPCPNGRLECPRVVAGKSVWVAFSALILTIQPCLCLIVFGYSLHLQDHSRRAYDVPEVSSRSPSTPTGHRGDQKRLLSNSEPWPTVELAVVEPTMTVEPLSMPEAETGYGGGMRTYEEAERYEKERLRRKMEEETDSEEESKGAVMSFPVPSTSEARVLTPLGLAWRDGDLPPYAS